MKEKIKAAIPSATLIIVLAILALTVSEKVVAEPFIGASAVSIDADEVTFTGATVTAGYNFNEVFAVRVRVLADSSDEELYGSIVEIDSMVGADIVLTAPMEGDVQPYISFGTTQVEVSASYMGYSASDKTTEATFGGGIRFNVRESLDIVAEVQRVDDANIYGAGIQYNF